MPLQGKQKKPVLSQNFFSLKSNYKWISEAKYTRLCFVSYVYVLSVVKTLPKIFCWHRPSQNHTMQLLSYLHLEGKTERMKAWLWSLWSAAWIIGGDQTRVQRSAGGGLCITSE